MFAAVASISVQSLQVRQDLNEVTYLWIGTLSQELHWCHLPSVWWQWSCSCFRGRVLWCRDALCLRQWQTVPWSRWRPARCMSSGVCSPSAPTAGSLHLRWRLLLSDWKQDAVLQKWHEKWLKHVLTHGNQWAVGKVRNYIWNWAFHLSKCFTKCQTKMKYMILSETIDIFQDQKAEILNTLIKMQWEIWS